MSNSTTLRAGAVVTIMLALRDVDVRRAGVSSDRDVAVPWSDIDNCGAVRFPRTRCGPSSAIVADHHSSNGSHLPDKRSESSEKRTYVFRSSVLITAHSRKNSSHSRTKGCKQHRTSHNSQYHAARAYKRRQAVIPAQSAPHVCSSLVLVRTIRK